MASGCMASIGPRLGILTLCVSAALTIFCRAASANGWEHGAIPFDALVKALNDGDTITRLQAAHSLGARGQSEAVRFLILRRRHTAGA